MGCDDNVVHMQQGTVGPGGFLFLHIQRRAVDGPAAAEESPPPKLSPDVIEELLLFDAPVRFLEEPLA